MEFQLVCLRWYWISFLLDQQKQQQRLTAHRVSTPRGSLGSPRSCMLTNSPHVHEYRPELPCPLNSLRLPFPSLSCSLQAAIALRRCRVCCRLRWLRPCSCCPLLAEPGPRCGHGPPSQPAGQASARSSSPSYGHRCAALRSPWATAAVATPLLAPAGRAKVTAGHGRAGRPLSCPVWPRSRPIQPLPGADGRSFPLSLVCSV